MTHALETADLWHIEFGPNDVRVLTLDQLDAAFQAGAVNEETRVWQEGMAEAVSLGELLGAGEEDGEAEQAPPAAEPEERWNETSAEYAVSRGAAPQEVEQELEEAAFGASPRHDAQTTLIGLQVETPAQGRAEELAEENGWESRSDDWDDEAAAMAQRAEARAAEAQAELQAQPAMPRVVSASYPSLQATQVPPSVQLRSEVPAGHPVAQPAAHPSIYPPPAVQAAAQPSVRPQQAQYGGYPPVVQAAAQPSVRPQQAQYGGYPPVVQAAAPAPQQAGFGPRSTGFGAQHSGFAPQPTGFGAQRGSGPQSQPGPQSYASRAPVSRAPAQAAASSASAWPPVVVAPASAAHSVPSPSIPSSVVPSVVPMAMDLSDDVPFAKPRRGAKFVVLGGGLLAAAAAAVAFNAGAFSMPASEPVVAKPAPVVAAAPKSHAYDPGSAPIKLGEEKTLTLTKRDETDKPKEDTQAGAKEEKAVETKSTKLTKPSMLAKPKASAKASRGARRSGGGSRSGGPFKSGGNQYDPLNSSL